MERLRNGIPVDVVEDLLDVVASVERVLDFGGKASPTEVWNAPEGAGAGYESMKDIVFWAVRHMAAGNRSGAEACVERVRGALGRRLGGLE